MNKPHLSKLRHEQEQDEAEAVAWVKSVSPGDLVRVWSQIQEMNDTTYENGELISRFAQLGMAHAVLLADYGNDGGKK